ncbi:MAG TPA: BadF/BadG/BcrA/BcrD ATPase family protein [Chloroflexota bacterium]|nr:BadF/BadG/BcrA/BcrD ATPase family protein [Chloroflexota bacterium]
MERAVWVGVDGGGTHTIALVGDCAATDGLRVLGRGEAGPANPQAVGYDTSATTIATAIRRAVAQSGLEQPRLTRVTLGIAGASRANDRLRLGKLLAGQLGVAFEEVQVVADTALILPAAGFASGVALIAGTGSAAYGVGRDGRVALAGGWGYLIGDDGSGFAIGREALRAVLRADDDLSPATGLAEAFAASLGVSQPRDLIRVIYQAESPRAAIAELAPLVAETARTGDEIAREILDRAGQDLAHIAVSVARRLGLGADAPVVGAGGMFQAGDVFAASLRADLARQGLPNFRLLDAAPALGALRLAMERTN